MSSTLDVQVPWGGEPHANTLVRLSIGERFFPGGRMGIFGDEAWTNDEGHAEFTIPEYDDYSKRYVNFRIRGTWFGSWDLQPGDCGYTVNEDSDEVAEEDDEDESDEKDDDDVG